MAYSVLEFDDAYLKQVNKERVACGLPPLLKTERTCLRCEKKFLAVGNTNRMCHRCRYKEEVP